MTVGYVAGVADPLAQSTKGAKGLRRRLLSSRVLTLNGWVAFNLPRTVTALGGALLTGLVLVHIYVLTTEPGLPRYFAAYVLGLSAACALAAGAMVFALKPIVPQAGWYFGSLVCSAFLCAYLVTRWVQLPGLIAVTARWDFAPGTLGIAFAGAFLAVHTTVLSGINVAYPQRQQWYD
ncbi:oxidoreductase [Mycobacterium avium subsp. hominissuis 10-4249]|nr:oxidoreductase [Mycobacterium avium subsp. hominissuis 10-4249]